MVRLLLCSGVLLWSLPLWAGVIAEGRSSVSPDVVIDADWRMYTLYTGEESCAKTPVIRRLEVVPNPIRIRVGETWHPGTLIVRAYDANDKFFSEVPLMLSLQEAPTLVDTTGADSNVRALQSGNVRLTVSNFCDDGITVSVQMLIED